RTQRQSVRRRVVRGDAPKRRAGGPERAAFAARDGAWQEADGAPPSRRGGATAKPSGRQGTRPHHRQRHREAPMAARAGGPTTGHATAKPQWPPGQATPHPPAPPGSARLIRLIRRAEVAVERFDDIVDRAVGNGVVDRLRLTP